MGIVYGTKFLISESKNITIDGIILGMTINLLDASDNVVKSCRAQGTSLVFDMIGFEAPMSYKLQAIGTDGVELLKTDALTIYHGDTWTYSGDTAGVTVNAKKVISNNNIAGGF